MKKTLYVDVTQLIHLQGPVTGIPRVMHELAIRTHTEIKGAVFVGWVKEVQAYCEIDFVASVLHRGNGVKYVRNGYEENVSPIDQRKVSLSRTLALGSVKKAIKYGISQSRRIHPSLTAKIESRIQREKASRYKKVVLKKNDTLFIGWGEWWDGNFLNMLEDSRRRGANITTIIHDIGPMITPHLSGHSSDSLAEYCRRIVPICKIVFVNSKYTGKELKNWLKIQKLTIPPISVFLLGDNFTAKKPKRPESDVFKSARLSGGDYIMTVGTIELKKNHILLYNVYYLARQRGIDLPKLVIVGRQGWHTEATIDLMTKDPILKEKFIFMHNTSDEELSWLYENCLFTVFPSFYEGWGIPIAESLYYGVPVISANVTSMLEIGDGIVERFSPASADECLNLMASLLEPSKLKAAKKKVTKYIPATWENSHQQIKTALEKEQLL